MSVSSADRRNEIRVVGIYALLTAGWLLASSWLIPAVVRFAHARNLGVLSDLMSARTTTPVDEYLEMWSGLADAVTTVVLAGGGLILFLSVLSITVKAKARGLKRRAGEVEVQAETGCVISALWFATWFGLLTGSAEALYLAKKYAFREWIPAKLGVSQDFLWMIPLAYTGTFILLVLPLSLAGRRWPKVTHPVVMASFLGFMGFLSLFQATAARLEFYAAAILAVGLAAQMSRTARARPAAFTAIVRRGSIWLLGAWILTAAAVPAARWMREHQAELDSLEEGGAASSTDSPNVLLIILDTVRAKNLSLYEYPRPTTPEMIRVSRTGIVFDRAIAPSPWTLPTHASVFTGRPHHELSTDWKQPLDDTHVTLAEFLGSRGYATAGFLGNFYYAGDAFGLSRGFARYEDQPRSLGMILHSAWLTRTLAQRVRRRLGIHQNLARKTADDINRAFLDWLDRDDDRPFFAFLNYFDAHDPYLPPAPFDTRFSREQPLYWLATDDATKLEKSDIDELQDAYDGSLAYLDDRLGVLFDRLEERGVLENTVLIMTSDHGEEFGEHGLMFHGHTLYLPSVQVPLLISFPGRVPTGVRVRDPVSLTDIPATIADLIGMDDESPFPGSSLVRMLRTSTATLVTDSVEAHAPGPAPVLSEVTVNPRTPESYPVHKGDMYALLQWPYRYIRNGDGTEELYDVDADPEEQTDVAASEAGQVVLRSLRAQLTAILGSAERPARP